MVQYLVSAAMPFDNYSYDHGSLGTRAGHSEREKYGLPRLMEALESNMWSTMQRNTANAASKPTAHQSALVKTSSCSTEPQNADAVPTPDALETAAAESQPEQSASPQAVQGAEQAQQEEAGDPLEDGLLADTEDNEIIDKFANFISEVRFCAKTTTLCVDVPTYTNYSPEYY